MVIVESQEICSELLELIKQQDFILIPVFYENKTHSSINKISLLYFYFITNDLSYLVPINHPDCIGEFAADLFENITSTKSKKFVIDKREMQHYLHNELNDSWLDVQLLDYINNGELTVDFEEYTPAHKFIYRKFYKKQETNLIIPVTKHIEFLEDNKNKMLKIIKSSNIDSKTFLDMNSIMLDTLYNAESSLIRVNNGMLKKEFVNSGFAQSKYNPYTITGRPSCTYKGFNFMGMNKEDGSRKDFISRFGVDGMLVLVDYDACHFYLMADLIDEPFSENPYDFLGKFYFNKTELTKEEHEQSKLLSFNVIYGGIPDEFLNISFFNKIRNFVYEQYDLYTKRGYCETHYFKRKIYSHKLKKMTPYKLFNYYMQAMETENHMIVLNDLFKQINQYDSKIILYIYDSILIDFKISEGKQFIDKITTALNQENKFPVSVSYGTNYHSMRKLL